MSDPNELRQALLGDSAHTPPMRLTEALSEALAHTEIPLAPHTIYQELWHINFWLRISHDWIAGIVTPYPASPHDAFPNPAQTAAESWEDLRLRFRRDIERAAELTANPAELARLVQCPSRPGHPTRTMSVQDQLVSLAAHNSYHFGRIVLLRQQLRSWPPPSGSFTW